MKKLLRVAIIAALALTIAVPLFSAPALALDIGTNYANGVGLGNRDPRDIAASIVRIILGFLGILAVIIILIGGFKWMTAAGNDDQVGEAKKIIVAGIIGLAIILAAWGISQFVINALINATGTV